MGGGGSEREEKTGNKDIKQETYFHSYFYLTTKHEILQISNHSVLCSLDPLNQGWLF